MVEETIAQEADGKSANRVFSVEILRLIRDAQKQHGLRHGDYQRYRGMSEKRFNASNNNCPKTYQEKKSNLLEVILTVSTPITCQLCYFFLLLVNLSRLIAIYKYFITFNSINSIFVFSFFFVSASSII